MAGMYRGHWICSKRAPSDTTPSDRGVVQFVLEMRDRLARYQDEAEVNLREAQKSQKTWYDKQARHREFQPGQKVLLLLPSSNSKLLAKWQGPYIITRKMGPVTYEVHQPEKKKPVQTYHVNLLKEWKERPIQALMVREVDMEEEEETELETQSKTATPVLAHLAPEQAAQLLQVFQEARSLFATSPGQTTLVEHVVRLKDERPIRQRPYRIPQQLVDKLRQEVEEMLKLGVIEPSNSEWCSPVVIVFKKDGSLRICIDFRKLNAISEFDAYPMPRIDDLLEKIGAAKYITTLDLCKGYWQVPLEKSCRPYTAFRTPAGLFQFTVMPFGLHGALSAVLTQRIDPKGDPTFTNGHVRIIKRLQITLSLCASPSPDAVQEGRRKEEGGPEEYPGLGRSYFCLNGPLIFSSFSLPLP
ncbi:uncharacterized protein LOC133136803 [Conger conger]|uniref:uncharacterized protein LOC133136803 n=1 Tax=Conger conger TaxID=82655 RepID=UPI002A5AD8E4|nr:uncharacterized protein LOC133136803 [Conger conger]